MNISSEQIISHHEKYSYYFRKNEPCKWWIVDLDCKKLPKTYILQRIEVLDKKKFADLDILMLCIISISFYLIL